MLLGGILTMDNLGRLEVIVVNACPTMKVIFAMDVECMLKVVNTVIFNVC